MAEEIIELGVAYSYTVYPATTKQFILILLIVPNTQKEFILKLFSKKNYYKVAKHVINVIKYVFKQLKFKFN